MADRIGMVGHAPMVTVGPVNEQDRKMEADLREALVGKTVTGVHLAGEQMTIESAGGGRVDFMLSGGFRRTD